MQCYECCGRANQEVYCYSAVTTALCANDTFYYRISVLMPLKLMQFDDNHTHCHRLTVNKQRKSVKEKQQLFLL